jgi:putative hydrolase
MSDIDPSELAGAFSQIPLFREIQKLLGSQSGPVNWELAEQLARGLAAAGGKQIAGAPELQRQLLDECRLAEMRLAHATGVGPTSGVTDVEVVDRAQWTTQTLDLVRPHVERIAAKLEISAAQSAGPAEPGNPEAGFGNLQAAFGALGPLVFGMQTGMLIGYLSHGVIGGYETPLPRKPGTITFVLPNATHAAAELEVEERQFLLWIALHEVSRDIEFSAFPWLGEHLVALLENYVDAAELNLEEAGRAMEGMDSLGGPENVSRFLKKPEDLLPMLVSPAQRAIGDGVRAVIAVVEGYSDWAMARAGRDLLPEFDKIKEGMVRRSLEQPTGEHLIQRLFGIDLPPGTRRAAEQFISRIAETGHLENLLAGPENLPSIAELTDVTKWLSRVAFS